jgi:hypothetical protein
MGLRVPDAQALLEPAEQLLGPTDYWLHPGDGLALFLSAARMHQYSLPIHLKKKLVIADRFHLKPLLPLFSGDESFFILALSQNVIRLFQGTRHSILPMNIESTSESLSRFFRSEAPEKHLGWYMPSGSPRAPGRQAAIVHGTGGGKKDDHKKLLEYFRLLDGGLRVILRDQPAPLILAGVNHLHRVFREASSHPYIFETGISGNPERLSAEELHAKAWRILQPHFQQTRQATKKRYSQLSKQGSHLASDHLERILPAAHNGQVESLFVAVGVQRWGEFDPVSQRVEQKDTYHPRCEDLLDRAAVLTLQNGGMVFAVRPDQVPSQRPIAALFRY